MISKGGTPDNLVAIVRCRANKGIFNVTQKTDTTNTEIKIGPEYTLVRATDVVNASASHRKYKAIVRVLY